MKTLMIDIMLNDRFYAAFRYRYCPAFKFDIEDMAKIVDNPKRFKVIELSRNELAKIGGIGICDRCNGTSNTGYYVAVLNCWFCPKCYNEWYGCATHYPEDIKIENKNFEYYKNLFDL